MTRFYIKATYTNIILRLNLKIQTILLFLFLSTGIFNNSFADTITSSLDSIQAKNNLFDDEIEQFAEDSLKINIEQKKAFLYGNAKIKYQNNLLNSDKK